ncbi:MAG TPA: glucosidase, partial [Blastocatellia bacterium]
GWFKDAFHRSIVNGENSVNPECCGSKACLHYKFVVPGGSSVSVRLRLTADPAGDPISSVEETINLRRAEADEFYAAIHPPKATDDERLVQRQAFAGLLWSKQVYLFDVDQWLQGHRARGMSRDAVSALRNARWRHLNSMRVILMPDKWEYPWFAAWDLAFQCVALALVDGHLAKDQLWLMLFEQFQHPNGQIPAYEWEFSDLNPPVHAWACWRVYNMDRIRSGKADRFWLERCFHKLLLNFTWWINKVDSQGNNIFEGGFLGLDNITVIDRSEKLPGGVVLEQSDATGWMGMFCLNMMRIALELAKEDSVYESMATKFFEHYVYVGAAMKRMGGRDYSLWDEHDGFFYDVLAYPDGSYHKFRVRSLVGLVPLFAVERLEIDWIKPFAEFRANLNWFVNNRQDLVQRCCHLIRHDGMDVYVLSVVDREQMVRILEKIFNADEFLSDYGIRSLSKFHQLFPFVFGDNRVAYEPAESDSKIKGGNSNWRGPIWFPTAFLLLESLRKLGKAYGPQFSVQQFEGIDGSITLTDLSRIIADRLIGIFTRNSFDKRAVFGGSRKFQEDPHWRDYILFYEYFHGDSGAGIGASHQTGWTALVASLIDEWRR